MLIKKADGGDASPAKAPKASFFSRPGAVFKQHAAKVFQGYAPTTEADGITQSLKKPRPCNRQRLREHKNGEKFQFTTTLLHYLLFCLTHLVGVIGIHSKAFKAGHQSIDELLHRPNLEDVDYVPLEWRDEMLDQEIFPMSYTSFWRTLRRVLLVAGFVTLASVYAFRVGAFVEYDGSLTQTMRNFVASHTTDIFENNYQAERVREDLTRKQFGACAGGTTNEPLFKVLRGLSMQNDPGAPIEATPEQEGRQHRKPLGHYSKEGCTRAGQI